MNDRSPLFLVRPDADLVRMSPSAPSTEDELQELIARYPELIGDSDGALLLVERENSIPDKQDGAGRWSIDHLFVTLDATPVLVEVKRAADTRIRREVVGQMLDYAANGVAYWPTGSLAARFEVGCEARGSDATLELQAFLGEERNVSDYWEQVEANLRAGRIKLVFVADEIPSELARVVEFLNDQMTADVRAIELRYFEGPGGVRTLAPRVIGETEQTRARKGGQKPRLEPIGVDQWIEKNIAPKGAPVLAGAFALLKLMRELAPEVNVASTQGSVYARIKAPDGKHSYPFSIVEKGNAQISFGLLAGAPELAEEAVRRGFYDRFVRAVGPLSNSNLRGYPSFPLVRLSEPERLADFTIVAREFCNACGGGTPKGT